MTFETLVSILPNSIVDALKRCEQDPIYHPEGSVYNHMKLVFQKVKERSRDNDLLIAAIFHDLGKLDTTTKETKDGVERTHHYGHEKVSLKYIDKLLPLYYTMVKDENKVREVVREHMRAHKYIDGSMSNPDKRKAFEEAKYFEEILLFSKCDMYGR